MHLADDRIREMIHQMLAPPAEPTSHALPSFGEEGNAASPQAKETPEGEEKVGETRTAAAAPAPITFGGLTFATVDAEADIPEVEPVKGGEPEPSNAVTNQPSPPNQARQQRDHSRMKRGRVLRRVSSRSLPRRTRRPRSSPSLQRSRLAAPRNRLCRKNLFLRIGSIGQMT